MRITTAICGLLMCLVVPLTCQTARGAEGGDVPVSTDSALSAAEQQMSSTASMLQAGPAGGEPLTVSQAILMTLDNNRAFVVERYNTPMSRNLVEVQEAAFDAELTASAFLDRGKSRVPGRGSSRSQSEDVSVGLAKFFPLGTTVGVGGGTTITQEPDVAAKRYETSVELTATQALFRGYGSAVNLASVRQARIDVLSSEYELRGLAEALVAATEETYWNYVLALRQIEIVNESLKVAQQQMDDTRERIKVGQLAESEIFAAEAEVALRKQNLIEARSILEKTRVNLLRLMNPGTSPFTAEFAPVDSPATPAEDIGLVGDHVTVALAMRPDVNQARLLVNRGQLQLVKTRNGLLPRLDLFASLGRSAYSDSFGDSITGLDEGGHDFTLGLVGEYPLGNRRARALNSNAVMSRDQAVEAVGNLEQLAEADVRKAYVEVVRAREQSAATAATSRLQQEKLRIETAKFRVGKSTNLLVGQAQRDLLQAQIAEVQSLTSYRTALVGLYRLEGSLLTRKGIGCPGTEAVRMVAGPAEILPPPATVTAAP